MRREIGKFTARHRNGTTETVFVYQDFHDASDRVGPHRIPGMKSLATENGELVNYVEPGRFRVAATGEILVSDDPACPEFE